MSVCLQTIYILEFLMDNFAPLNGAYWMKSKIKTSIRNSST